MCGSGVWIRRDVRWTIVPCDDGRWEVRRTWRYITRWDAPDEPWKREPSSRHGSLEEALCAMGSDYKEGTTVPRGIQIKLGPTTVDGDYHTYFSKQREESK